MPQEILLELGFIEAIDKTCDDIGCDIIIKTDDGYKFIQCKHYSTTGIDNTINISDLSGFYNFMSENCFNNGIVYYSGNLSRQILSRKRKIQYINVPMYNIENQYMQIVPKVYQINAYNDLLSSNRSILNMPCGTGKTYVSYLLSLNYNIITILTPLISTTEQIFEHYKNYYNNNKNINFILVNSKAHRNINIKHDCKNIIFSTYASVDIINKYCGKIENQLIIIDEYHNLSEDMLTNEYNEMYKLLTYNNTYLFISATPHLDTIKYSNIFGTNIHCMKWDYAIENKLICDSNFYFPNNNLIIDNIDKMKIKTDFIEKSILINKAYFLLESIKLLKLNKCIIYLKTIEESKMFVKVIETINLYFELKIKVYEINKATPKKTRNNIMTRFRLDNNYTNIICNVHILDEGIDIPECDSVYLTHPNNNFINIIQRISRANRLTSDCNKVARILVWSKNELKMNDLVNKISNIFNIKYGDEKSDIINNFKNNTPKIKDDKPEIKDDNSIYHISSDNDNNDITKDETTSYFQHLQTETGSKDAIIYYCKLCNKTYSSYMGLWKHNKNNHKPKETIINEPEPVETNIHICKYCTKEFGDRTARWRHEKKYCKLNNIDEMNTSIIIFKQPGCENISKITQEQIILLVNDGVNSIIKMIEFIYFNKNIPENHTFCTTALNNKFLSVIDCKTNNIEKHRKAEFFDKVILYCIAHMKKINKIMSKNKNDFSNIILEIEKNITTNKDYKKNIINQINALSYNKRNMIEQTWDIVSSQVITQSS